MLYEFGAVAACRVHLVGFTIRIYHYARSPERHITLNPVQSNNLRLNQHQIKRVDLIMLIIALQFDVSTSKKKKRVSLIMLIIALMN